MKTQRIPTDGSGAFGSNPFAALDLGPLPDAKPTPAAPAASVVGKPHGTGAGTAPAPPKKRLPVHLRIEKAGRGGKTVTVLYGPGIEALSPAEQHALLKELKASLGSGGTLGALPGTLEIQGDERPRLTARFNK